MYKAFIRMNQGRFVSTHTFNTLEEVEEEIKDLTEAFGMEEKEFGIASYCDFCGKEREIYSDGCCKECFELYVKGEDGGAAK